MVVNHTLAGAYVTALKEIAEKYNLKEDFGASAISRYPDVLVVKKAEDDEEKIWSYVKETAEDAVARFTEMRAVEGAKMKEDVFSRSN